MNQINSFQIAVVYTTVGSLADAQKLAREALAEKLIACANIIQNGESVFVWNNAIETACECYIVFKTDLSKRNELIEWLGKNHPYNTPAILSWDVQTSFQFFEYVHNTLK